MASIYTIDYRIRVLWIPVSRRNGSHILSRDQLMFQLNRPIDTLGFNFRADYATRVLEALFPRTFAVRVETSLASILCLQRENPFRITRDTNYVRSREEKGGERTGALCMEDREGSFRAGSLCALNV